MITLLGTGFGAFGSSGKVEGGDWVECVWVDSVEDTFLSATFYRPLRVHMPSRLRWQAAYVVTVAGELQSAHVGVSVNAPEVVSLTPSRSRAVGGKRVQLRGWTLGVVNTSAREWMGRGVCRAAH